MGKPFQSGLIFKAINLPKRRAPERCSTWVGSALTHKCYVSLERFARDKCSRLFGLIINEYEKSFYDVDFWLFKLYKKAVVDFITFY